DKRRSGAVPGVAVSVHAVTIGFVCSGVIGVSEGASGGNGAPEDPMNDPSQPATRSSNSEVSQRMT
ncbi:MAG: hypothetical protein IT380_22905, partial [Myxococcales bacterium]|nr:hypothetical protein [Myxococcales bacterium]